MYPNASPLKHGDPAHLTLHRALKEPKDFWAFNKANSHLKGPDLKSKYGWLWWWSQIIYIFHKDAPYKYKLEEYVEKLGLPSTCVAMHVRRGDACADITATHRTCPHLSEFVQGVKKIEQVYGKVTHIYLATDAASAITETKAFPQYTWVVQRNISRAKYSKKDIDNNEHINTAQTVHELYNDVWAMSSCQGVVGSWSSSVMTLVYALMMGRNQFRPPFVSVDLPWGHERLGKSVLMFCSHLSFYLLIAFDQN